MFAVQDDKSISVQSKVCRFASNILVRLVLKINGPSAMTQAHCKKSAGLGFSAFPSSAPLPTGIQGVRIMDANKRLMLLAVL